MNEELFIPYYSKIANQLNRLIPVEWREAALYGEELGDNRTAEFFFKTEDGGEYIPGGKIPDIYKVDLNTYFKMTTELCGYIKELKNEFMRQGMQEWKAITFLLDQDFKFKIEYIYDVDMKVDSYERGIYWAYERLGIIPKSDFEKKILDEYLLIKKKNK